MGHAMGHAVVAVVAVAAAAAHATVIPAVAEFALLLRFHAERGGTRAAACIG